MKPRPLLPFLVLLVGCRPAANELPPVVYPGDASGLDAEAFIEQAVGLEWPKQEFFDEFGPGEVQERDGRVVLIYKCRDSSVVLGIDREKFGKGVISVVEWKPR